MCLATEANSWQSVWKARVIEVLKVEQGVVFVGVLLSALFYVMMPGAPLLMMGICMLVIGNLMYFIQTRAARLYGHYRFPWDWAIFLPMLAAGSAVSALLSILLLRIMRPDYPPYWALLRETWKIIAVVSMGTGIVGYAVQQVQRKLKEKNEQLEQAVQRGTVALAAQEEELNRARDIQTGLLPKTLPQHANLELAGEWQPARAIGGDYFDVVQLDADRFGICIGDVAGKGLTASLLMANLQAAFRAYATADASPAEVCSKLNAFVCGNVATGKFITFFYAILDARRRTLQYENAGHCPALLLHAQGAPEMLCGQGGVLGITQEWSYVNESKAVVAGDRLLLFTDGVTEAENAQAVEFGSERIVQAAGPVGTSAAESKTKVMQEVAKFCRGEFRDDVTLLVAAVR